jgi:putative two-component system response regulator
MTLQPMSAKQSCLYLIEGSGSRYDPAVIELLEPLLAAEGKFELEEQLVAVKHLHEGMRLTRDVLHPKGFVLLSQGGELTRRLIEQMAAVEQQTGGKLKVHVQRKPTPPASDTQNSAT